MRQHTLTSLFRWMIPKRLRRIMGLDRRVTLLEKRIIWLERLHPSLSNRAARFVACEMIEGDYIEFGIYEGQSFQAAYHAIHVAFEDRIMQLEGGVDPAQNAQRQALLNQMRFIGLDSFDGLPELNGTDRSGNDFKQGQYRTTEARFLRNIENAGLDLDKVITIPGWFSETSHRETWQRLGITKAAIIWIDCDLYQSAADALNGIRDLLQDGTVLIFDDWFAFKANPKRGEQRAFSEWRYTVGGFDFVEFHQEGTWRKSFIAVSKDA
jgi:bifunctional DNA-binding transcriptional regulator/antitoxin component of YhaV-PrlF toxin-antitoxin module